MAFLIKSLLCILIVCVALGWRSTPPSHVGATRSASAAQADAPWPPRRPRDIGLAERKDAERAPGPALLRAGVAALADAAREKCLSAPGDCLAALERIGASGSRSR